MSCPLPEQFRILVCEDDDSRYKYFQQGLIGSIILRATTPQEALSYRSLPFEVIFLDYDYDAEHTGKNSYGTDITRYVAENPASFKDTLFIIHSLSREGRTKMMDDLVEADVNFVIMEPMFWQQPEFSLETVKGWYQQVKEKGFVEPESGFARPLPFPFCTVPIKAPEDE